MKKQLLKTLFTFIIPIAIGMMFSSTVSNAQIIFTDLNPGILRECSSGGCSGDYSFDLDNDGIDDYTLTPDKIQNSCGACGLLILVSADGYSAAVSSTAHSWIADTIGGYALNTVIDSSLSWTNDFHILARAIDDCVPCTTFPGRGNHFEDTPPSGPWRNIYGKYLALKTQVGTNYYYGWIKLGVGISENFVKIRILEYAYNSIPNQPILAGQTMTTGIIENSFSSSINLFPNPADDHLTIDLGTNYGDTQVTIADISGKVIYSTIERETQKIEVNTKDFAAGIYVVQIQTGDFIATNKLVIEK